MKRALFTLLTLLILLTTGCREEDPVLKDLVIEKKNFPEYIEIIRNGYTGRRQMPIDLWRPTLEHLLIYQEHKKEEIYGGDENQYLYDRGMIYLLRHEFIESFELFREYIEKTGNRGEVFFQIMKNVDLINNSSTDILAKYEMKEIVQERFEPTYQQHEYLLKRTYANYITVLKKIGASDKLKESDVYSEQLKSWKIAYNKLKIQEEKEDFINHTIAPEIFPDYMIEEIVKNEHHSSYELDFLIRYYVGIYNQDYKKAAQWADRREIVVDQTGRELPTLRIMRMMKAYIGVGRYDDALNVFEVNKDKITNRVMSQSRFNLLLAVCYAGKGDLEKAKEFIKQDIEVTKVFDYESKRDNGGRQLRGDMVLSLFEFYFIYDEFDAFWETSRYQEIRNIFEDGLHRYSELDVFHKVK